jgi:toxin ParE1/3/4
MQRNIITTDKAKKQFAQMFRYIAERAGVLTADNFTRGVENQIERLGTFPHIGTKRDELKRGYRTVGFKKRVTIVFSVHEKDVVIHAILYGGRDLGKALL